MGEIVRCDCGFEARADDAAGLVEAIRLHAWEAHGMPLSYDEALMLAARTGHEGTAQGTT
jgi:hypothetical protein